MNAASDSKDNFQIKLTSLINCGFHFIPCIINFDILHNLGWLIRASVDVRQTNYENIRRLTFPYLSPLYLILCLERNLNFKVFHLN